MNENQGDRVTTRDNSLYLMLGNMQGDLKSILEAVNRSAHKHDKLEQEMNDRMNIHAERLADLEKFRWKLAGLAMAWPTVLIIGGWIVSKLGLN